MEGNVNADIPLWIRGVDEISLEEGILNKLTGRFYTNDTIAKKAIVSMLKYVPHNDYNRKIRICDPFGGDGRMVVHFIDEWVKLGLPKVEWEVHIWDINEQGLLIAQEKISRLKKHNIQIEINVNQVDSFYHGLRYRTYFDFVLTNPPWLLLKPDSRKLKSLPEEARKQYVSELRAYDRFIELNYPNSKPSLKFAGWGTNLSRVGLELSLNITKHHGFLLIVLPASIFADSQSIGMRRILFLENGISEIDYFPPEAKLFGKADTASTTVILRKNERLCEDYTLTSYNATLQVSESSRMPIDYERLVEDDFIIPISGGIKCNTVLNKIRKRLIRFGELEGSSSSSLWAGREIDETRSEEWLVLDGGGLKFVKGNMVCRYGYVTKPKFHVVKAGLVPPVSASFSKIVWRDVSRNSQKRRMIATIVSDGLIAGNSLGVCYFKNGDVDNLKILLGIMNSLCFEFQLKFHLATVHVSLSAIRKVFVPRKSSYKNFEKLGLLVDRALDGHFEKEFEIEAYVAKYVYNLNRNEFEIIIDSFQKITIEEKDNILKEFENI